MQQRHIIAHEYGDLDHEKLWRVATGRIPELLRQLEAILAQQGPGTGSSPDA